MASQPVPEAGFNQGKSVDFVVYPAGGRGWRWSREEFAANDAEQPNK